MRCTAATAEESTGGEGEEGEEKERSGSTAWKEEPMRVREAGLEEVQGRGGKRRLEKRKVLEDSA